MKSIFNIFSIFLFFPLLSLGQSVSEARSSFEQFNFELALDAYKKVKAESSKGLGYDDAEKLGYCYYITGDTSGIEFISSLIQEKPEEAHLLFWKGSLERDASRFEDAVISLSKFQDFETETDVSILIESCKLIPTWKTESRTSSIIDSVNFITANTKVIFGNDEFYLFEQELGEEQMTFTYNANTPIVPISKLYFRSDSIFKLIETVGFDNLSIGSIAKFPNSDSILFSAVSVSTNSDAGNYPQIYSGVLSKENASITKVQTWEHGFDDHVSYSHPTISADGNTIVYVQMKHGETSDLIKVNNVSGIWSEPELMSSINSKGNEMFPNFSSDSTLTFSSDGIPGYGGLDLYRTSYSNGVFDSVPVHFKDPINSTKDDFQLFWKDSLNGFLTSNRNGGVGDDDVWSILIEPIPVIVPPSGFQEWHAEWHGEKVYFPYKMDTTVLAENFIEGYLKYAEYYELEMDIVGHTDARGTSESNFDLAKRRALWLKSKFKDTSIKMSTLTIVSKGESTLDENKKYNEEEHRTNRYVELIISYKKKK